MNFWRTLQTTVTAAGCALVACLLPQDANAQGMMPANVSLVQGHAGYGDLSTFDSVSTDDRGVDYERINAGELLSFDDRTGWWTVLVHDIEQDQNGHLFGTVRLDIYNNENVLVATRDVPIKGRVRLTETTTVTVPDIGTQTATDRYRNQIRFGGSAAPRTEVDNPGLTGGARLVVQLTNRGEFLDGDLVDYISDTQGPDQYAGLSRVAVGREFRADSEILVDFDARAINSLVVPRDSITVDNVDFPRRFMGSANWIPVMNSDVDAFGGMFRSFVQYAVGDRPGRISTRARVDRVSAAMSGWVFTTAQTASADWIGEMSPAVESADIWNRRVSLRTPYSSSDTVIRYDRRAILDRDIE